MGIIDMEKMEYFENNKPKKIEEDKNKENVVERDYLEAWKKAKDDVKEDSFVKSINVPPAKGDYIKNAQIIHIIDWITEIAKTKLKDRAEVPKVMDLKVLEVDPNTSTIKIQLETNINGEIIKIETEIEKARLEWYGKNVY